MSTNSTIGGRKLKTALPDSRQIEIRLPFAYRVPVADQKEKTAILVAASLIAAIRLRGEPITNSPKVSNAIADSIQLARMIWARIVPDR